MIWFSLIGRELKRIFSWKSPFFYLIIGLPLVYTVLFGYVYQPAVVNQVPLIVYDADNTAATRSAIEAYGSADKFHLVGQSQSLEDFERTLKNEEALSGIYIPPHTTANIKLGRPASIAVVVNSTNIVYGNGMLPAHHEIATALTVKMTSKLAEAAGMPPDHAMETAYPVRTQFRIRDNPTNSYEYFMLLGLVINGLQIGAFLVAATVLCRQYRRIRSIRRYNSFGFAAVQMGITWFFAMCSALLCFSISRYLFGIPMVAPFWKFAVLTGAFFFFFISACMIFSAVLPDTVISSQLPMAYVMPALLYSGMSWPKPWMNEYAIAISNAMPLSYFGDTLRDLSLRGSSVVFWDRTEAMLFYGALCFLVSVGIFALQRRRLEHKIQARLLERRGAA